MRTLVSILLAGSLGLTLGAPSAAGPETPEPEQLVQSFSFSADCGDDPGRMEVRAASVGPEEFSIAMRATGLTPGFQRGMIEVQGSQPSAPYEEWDVDPEATEVEHETTYPAPLTTGRQIGATVADFFPPMGVCSVSGWADDETGIRVGIGSRELHMTSRRIQAMVQHVDCRDAETVRGRAVIRLDDRTVRTRLKPGRCTVVDGHDGYVRLTARFPRTRLPRAASVVLRYADETWRAEYDLVLFEDEQEERAAGRGRGFNRITFAADCTAVPGRMQVREVRADRDHMLVNMQATGLPVTGRTWHGQVYLQPGEIGYAETFERRAPEGRARHTSTWDVPIASTPVSVSLTDMAGEGQPECGLYVSHSRTTAAVESGSAHLLAGVWEGALDVRFTDRDCRNGTTWKGRIVATWPDHTVRRSLPARTCRYGSIGLGRALAGEDLPRALALVARSDAGDVWRASYGIGTTVADSAG